MREAKPYEVLAKFYDDVVVAFPYKEWADFILELMRLHGIVAERILDIACGTGTLDFILEERGFEVKGIDASPQMIEIAARKGAQRGSNIEFAVGDMCSTYLGERFDLVICTFDSLNYVPPQDLLKALANVREHLANGGAFIADVCTPRELLSWHGKKIWRQIGKVRQLWVYNYNSGERKLRIEINFALPDEEVREVHYEYGFSPRQIKHFSHLAGFEGVKFYADRRVGRPGIRCNRFWVVASRGYGN